MKNFAIIGVAGYIAPRHLKAIKETGNHLVAAIDKFDSVGILDSYFPEASFFTEFERFDRHVELLRRKEENKDAGSDGGNSQAIHYVSVCSPNYLHDAHIRFGLRVGADVICEKPLVLNPWNIEALSKIEAETGKKVFNIFQLRLHPSIIALKKQISEAPDDKIYDIDLTYITSRGNWYYTSWKGDVSRSGGIATNIGVHFYDMLTWIFGDVKESIVHVASHDRVAGYLRLGKANVRYFLSINEETLPAEAKAAGKKTFRLLQMNGEEIEFSEGFTDLHTESYRQILAGNGYQLSEANASIQLVHDIRHATPIGIKGDYHPCAGLSLSRHPFDRRS
ncbi:MAG TPA: Gfo/Idh/MocA family oxidoreductase [Prolixibacteraceae bacterium]|nr:Gfo/Idh/MocA family oxidoreductase [Prolixibacteraceae bacterium]